MPAATAPKSLMILHGDSAVLKRRAIEKLLQTHLAGEDPEFALQQVWAREAEVAEMANAIGSVSLLATARVVVLHELQALSATQQRPLATVLGRTPPGTMVVITTSPPAERKDRKPPLAAAILKLAAQVGEIRELFTPYERELGSWVQEEAGAYGKRISPAATRLLIETVGADCDRLVNEVAKLSAYMGEASEISPEAVRECASATDERGVFDLVDAIGRKDVALALDILKVLLPRGATRGAAIPLLGMITRHLRLLWQAIYVLKSNGSLLKPASGEVAARLPQNQNLTDSIKGRRFLADKYDRQARNFTDGQLARAMLKAYEADLALKGQGEQQMDDRMIVETLVVSLCRR